MQPLQAAQLDSVKQEPHAAVKAAKPRVSKLWKAPVVTCSTQLRRWSSLWVGSCDLSCSGFADWYVPATTPATRSSIAGQAQLDAVDPRAGAPAGTEAIAWPFADDALPVPTPEGVDYDAGLRTAIGRVLHRLDGAATVQDVYAAAVVACTAASAEVQPLQAGSALTCESGALCPSCAAPKHRETSLNCYVCQLPAVAPDLQERIDAACAELHGTLPGGDLQATVPADMGGRVLGGAANTCNGKPRVRLPSQIDSAHWLTACAPRASGRDGASVRKPDNASATGSPANAHLHGQEAPLEMVLKVLREMEPDCAFKLSRLGIPVWPYSCEAGPSGYTQRGCSGLHASAATVSRDHTAMSDGNAGTARSMGAEWLVLPSTGADTSGVAGAEEASASAAMCLVNVRLKAYTPSAADEKQLANLDAAW